MLTDLVRMAKITNFVRYLGQMVGIKSNLSWIVSNCSGMAEYLGEVPRGGIQILVEI